MEIVETVDEHCQHADCIYRMKLDSTTEYCAYCMFEHHSRGCAISECDKYLKGERRVRMIRNGLWFDWFLEDEQYDYEIH